MSTPCCAEHPEGCSTMGFYSLIALVIVGATLGWKWAALVVLITTELDWLIRVWKHKS